MMCHKMGRPPTSTIGFGRNSVSSRRRVPRPPHRITTFTEKGLLCRNLQALHYFTRRSVNQPLRGGYGPNQHGSRDLQKREPATRGRRRIGGRGSESLRERPPVPAPVSRR